MANERSQAAFPESLASTRGLPAGSLRSRAIRASAITVGGYAASQLLRIGSNMALTRLLFPEAFGIMALVLVLLAGLEMISDIGIQPSIVRHERGDDPLFLNTAWTIQVMRGVVLWICGILLASPFASFYGEPQLAQLVPIATAAAVLSGLNSTKIATLNRRMTIGPMVLIDLSSQMIAIVVMITIALIHRSIWALVVGGLVLPLMKMLLSHFVLAGPRNRIGWDREARDEILVFGKWIFVSTLATFLAMRLDIFLLGRLIPMELLGIYSIAGLLALLPQQITNRMAGLVLLPVLAASARDSKERLSTNLDRARCIVLPAGLFCVLGIALLAPAFFYYLYDPRYHAAGWMAQLLMLSVWFHLLQQFVSRTLLALGDSWSLAVSNIARLVFSATGCVVGFKIAGLPGLILGVSMGSLAGYIWVMSALAPHGLTAWLEDLRYTFIGCACGAIGGWGPHLTGRLFGFENVALLGLPFAVVILAPLALLAAHRTRRVLARHANTVGS